MKVASMLLAALSLSAATTAATSNSGDSLMDDDGEQLFISKSRQLQQQYDTTSTNDAPLSGGTWLFYLMLNAFMFPWDAAGYGCNCDDDATTTYNNYYEDNNWGGRALWGSDSWDDDGYNHHSFSSSSSSSSSHSSSSRCKVAHAPKLKSHPPHKPPSSPQKHSSGSSSSSSSSSSSGSSSGSSHSYSTWTHDGYDYDAPAWATDGYDEASTHVSHLTDGNGSNIGSAANMGMIVGVAVATLAAIAAAAFMMKKGCSKNGILPSRWNHKKPDVDANTLSDTDDSSRSDDDDDINRVNYIEMTDLQYEELARADANSHGAGYTNKLMERLGALRSSANMVFCPAKMLCPSKNTVTV